jgi:hypothetical protein
MDGKAARVAETEAGAEGIKIASRTHRAKSMKQEGRTKSQKVKIRKEKSAGRGQIQPKSLSNSLWVPIQTHSMISPSR